MLVDLPEDFWVDTGRIQQGVYQVRWDFEHSADLHALFEDEMGDHWYPLPLWGYELYIPELGNMDDEDEPYPVQSCWPMYGLCDHWSQILVKFPQLVTSVIPYLIRVSPVFRADQHASGGFRFYKWGSYIGAFREETQFEYLYDSGLECVYTYEVYQMKMKKGD